MAKTETESEVGCFGKELINLKAEIDTSAPFESVKEAVCRFGGVGYWKPSNKSFENEQQQHEVEEISIENLEEQTSELEKDLISKQRETLNILQELESTRAFVEDLKMELRNDDKENNRYPKSRQTHKFLEESFKKAQQKLTKTTNGISEIRASIEVFNKKLEKTREKLKQNSTEIVLKELQILNSEAEKFKQMSEVAKCEILKTISRIEESKCYESKIEILKQVKEAREEIKSTKFALEEVLKNSIEEAAAKREEMMEKWGWENGKKMEYHCPIGAADVIKPTTTTLSIGQILSRKLFLQEELMSSGKRRKVSLAQMLGKHNRAMPKCATVERRESDRKHENRKRKESGFAARPRFPFLAKQNNDKKRKKQPTLNLK